MRSLVTLACLVCITAGSAAESVDLVANGGFTGTADEVATAKSQFGRDVVISGDPERQLFWKTITPSRVSLQTENGNQFLRLVLADPGKGMTTVTQDYMILDPQWKSVTLTAKIRATGAKRKGGLTDGAKILLQFMTEKGDLIARIGEFELGIVADSDWTSISRTVAIPKGSAMLTARCLVMGVSGTFDFDDISIVAVVPTAPAPVPAPAIAPHRRKK